MTLLSSHYGVRELRWIRPLLEANRWFRGKVTSVATFLQVPTSTYKHESRRQALLPLLTSRSLQLNQEFAFLPSSPPQSKGGIFELRTYELKPGTLLEWEAAW
jgi:hypothetical protein